MKRSCLPSLLTLAAVLLAGLLSACGSSDAIFYTLEQERELVDDRGIPDDITVHRVVLAPGAPDRYFAAAGRVYWREAGGNGQWQVIAPPPGISGALCTHIEYFAASGDIVAWFFNTSNVYDNGLYALDPANVAGPWTAVTPPALDALSNRRATLLKQVNGQLFVAIDHSGTLHALYSLDGAYSATGATFLPGAPGLILDVEWDTSAYWVAALPNGSGEWLYTGPLGALAVDAGPAGMTVTVGRPAGALFHAGSGNLYLSSENGKIFLHNGGWSTWTGDPVQVDSENVRFTQFVAADAPYIFVGTKGRGYYRFTAGTVGSAADLTRGPSYNISGLYNGAVLSFLAVGAGPDTLFACTYGNGLWRADYQGGTEPWPWVQE